MTSVKMLFCMHSLLRSLSAIIKPRVSSFGRERVDGRMEVREGH